MKQSIKLKISGIFWIAQKGATHLHRAENRTKIKSCPLWGRNLGGCFQWQ